MFHINFAILSEAVTPPTFDWSSAFSGIDAAYIMSAVFGAAPTVMPIVLGCLAARKGLRFVLGLLRRA